LPEAKLLLDELVQILLDRGQELFQPFRSKCRLLGDGSLNGPLGQRDTLGQNRPLGR